MLHRKKCVVMSSHHIRKEDNKCGDVLLVIRDKFHKVVK